MNRLQRALAPLWAFVITLTLLLGVGGALRVESATRATLHGEGASFHMAAVHAATDRAAEAVTPLLPARTALPIQVFRRAVDAVAAWLA